MTSIMDGNVFNIAIHGSFDDGQAIVKKIFNDIEFKTSPEPRGHQLDQLGQGPGPGGLLCLQLPACLPPREGLMPGLFGADRQFRRYLCRLHRQDGCCRKAVSASSSWPPTPMTSSPASSTGAIIPSARSCRPPARPWISRPPPISSAISTISSTRNRNGSRN